MTCYHYLRCDTHGVPQLIQSLEYRYFDMKVVATFFNGKTKWFYAEDVGDCMGLTQRIPTRMQELQILNNIEKLAAVEWHKWFPFLTAVR